MAATITLVEDATLGFIRKVGIEWTSHTDGTVSLGIQTVTLHNKPLYGCIGKIVTDPDGIREGLVKQVTGTVRWTESVQAMAADGVAVLYELGSGNVLTGLTRRINRDLNAMAAGTPDAIEELAGKL